MKRKEFLTEFLSALGAIKILWHKELDDYISGTVIYELDDPEEMQDFCWHKSENNLPDNTTFQIVTILNKHNLLDIDKLTISRKELHSLFNKDLKTSLSINAFEQALEELERIEVSMIDDGEETDSYFIHE